LRHYKPLFAGLDRTFGNHFMALARPEKKERIAGPQNPSQCLEISLRFAAISPTTKRGLKLPTIRLAEVGDGEVPD
jgi:hypothetical protein